MDIIIPHTNTDLDALGAAVGAQILYPGAVIIIPGTTSPLASEFISLHRYNLRVRMPREVDMDSVTRAIVVDTADPERLGPLNAVLDRVEVHLYDHHPAEVDDIQGTLMVHALVGATCTLIAELIQEAGVSISPFQATAMLLGIYTDTGNLSLEGTTPRDAAAAAFLLSKGANLRAVARFSDTMLSPTQESLLHQLQNQSRWLHVRSARIRVVEGETPEYVNGLSLVVHRLQDSRPAPALFAVVKMADRVHLVCRSEVPWVDVSKVAAAFGGGGHRGAASAVVKGATVSEVSAQLESILDETVQRPVMAGDVMTTPVKSIPADKPIREAERVMLRHGHSGLPVVDDRGRLAGVVSLRDAANARRHGLNHAPVKGVMNRRVVTVDPWTPLDEVQELILTKDIGRVPVVVKGDLVGIVSRSDLLHMFYGGPIPRWHRTLYMPGDGMTGVSAEVTRAMENCSPPIQSLLRTAGAVAVEMGVAAYVVGGFVRDMLLERPNLDVDIVVEGDGIAYAHALAAVLEGSVKEVPRFGTAHIYLGKREEGLPRRIDVATARKEFYEYAAALPVVEHANLREDLYRRDFSINAMAIRLGSGGLGGLVDYFGGLQDLKARQIRILHTLSFVEDPTRIMRAARFARRYQFTLETETAQCARTAIAEGFLDRVSVERLRNELVLILKEPEALEALGILYDLGLLQRLLPGVNPAEHLLVDQVDDLPQQVPDLCHGAHLWAAKLILLLYRLPTAQGVAVARRLKLQRIPARHVLQALEEWRSALDTLSRPRVSRGVVARTLSDWSQEGMLALYLLGAKTPILQYWRQWRKIRLDIKGSDLLAAGVPAGPHIGRALEQVLCDRLDGRAPDRETQLALALRYASEEV